MKYYAWFTACLIIGLIQGQNCHSKLSGVVLDLADGTPLAGVSLSIKSLNAYTYTDAKGRFVFNNLCNGDLAITTSHVSHKTDNQSIKINGDTYSKIYLKRRLEHLKSAVVTLQSNPLLSKTAQETQLSSKLIENYSAASLGTALKEVSGVSSLNTGNSIVKPIINGLHSSRVAVINNGVRLEDQEWGIEHAPNVDINTAGSITVIKGASALAYAGDAIGGIVILKPVAVPRKDSIYGKTIASGQSNGRGYSLNSTLTRSFASGWYTTGQASAQRYGDFKAPHYYLSNTGVKRLGFSINTGYKSANKGFNAYYSYLNTDIGILKAAHIGNVEDLVQAINTGRPLVINDFDYAIEAPRQTIKHQLAKITFYKRLKSLGKLNIQYDYQNNNRLEYDLRIGKDRFKPAIDLTLKSHHLKTFLEFSNHAKNRYTLGISANYQNNFANPGTGIRRLIPDYDRYSIGGFLFRTSL